MGNYRIKNSCLNYSICINKRCNFKVPLSPKMHHLKKKKAVKMPNHQSRYLLLVYRSLLPGCLPNPLALWAGQSHLPAEQMHELHSASSHAASCHSRPLLTSTTGKEEMSRCTEKINKSYHMQYLPHSNIRCSDRSSTVFNFVREHRHHSSFAVPSSLHKAPMPPTGGGTSAAMVLQSSGKDSQSCPKANSSHADGPPAAAAPLPEHHLSCAGQARTWGPHSTDGAPISTAGPHVRFASLHVGRWGRLYSVYPS